MHNVQAAADLEELVNFSGTILKVPTSSPKPQTLNPKV